MNGHPIRVGIIGVHPDQGWASTAHIPALQRLPEYRIQVISHHDAAIAQAAADRFDVPRAVDSSQQLVEQPDVDLVVVTVKVPRHRELITQALEAGKAVLSEWPLGVDLQEAQALQRLAAEKEAKTFIGLQTRSAPALAFARHLIRDGYVGEVLSATLIGSGILWGEAMSDAYAYTLDPANGASMLEVPFAHSIDGMLHVLDSHVATFACIVGNARRTTRLSESGIEQRLDVPDQIQVIGTLRSCAPFTAHFRGGLSRATNFYLEINGTRGDLVITSPIGYVGIGGMRVMGATGEEALHELEIPEAYDLHNDVPMPAQSIAIQYSRIASDFLHGTRLSPTFADAVELHRLIGAIRNTGSTP